ncbi:glycoside hydrolase family 95 protein [Cellulophaga sp. F20128]|uniref:glycosyl hydrolase family 95 catalytic domain-containing protein n=1 Tax=Cellulophaga sp. F20128 TaxID=2926413 RepID=UPI001FF4A63F|nr:glycoside hydrolase N-terminal domain-containing protein [Cellulophaga sp. F20128]MCK0158254.1 glycoside hydrolase family 95 protein [Cellulophaga sp. F20128]
MKNILLISILTLFVSCSKQKKGVDIDWGKHDLDFKTLAQSWDEGIPLGNGVIGALVWEKEERLRMSLDNVNLWDLRPMENLNTPNYKFSWVYEQWKNNNYEEVQKNFDAPYDNSPAPSKIPGAGLEFEIAEFGNVISNKLAITDAISEIKWENGVTMNSFVHATDQVGWFRFDGVKEGFKPMLVPPAYNSSGKDEMESPVTGQDLRRLGYPEGTIIEKDNSITYKQEGWGGFEYEVNVSWLQIGNVVAGCWSISADYEKLEKSKKANVFVAEQLNKGFAKAFESHSVWWKQFWGKSSLRIPDPILEKQWYLEQYKFGSAARDGAPPISLQAVWTADNGKLPPWKGDYHHDLNTQLSYWASYSGNHLDLENGYLEWLLKYKKTFKTYTKEYFESDGLAVPGVTTLTGEPMGGWIQYSFGPTVSAWLSQHFYMHWRYSMDKEFLSKKAYPWIKDVAVFFDNISIIDDAGLRKLPLSSSPEIHNNSREAWFDETTNFDLAAIRWTYEKAAELALELGKNEEAENWINTLNEWPYFSIDESEGLKFAPEHPYEESHRHFSHLMAFHPYGLIDYSNGENDKKIIDNTINHLVDKGSDWWTGYSFSWLGNLQARAFDGEGAAKTLRIFAENFCLPNSFHVNGEQHNKGYSKFKYRPFTLEGNFAFASAIQEMLIQSHTGIVILFPAIPHNWKNSSFESLRTEGAFLVTAKMEDGTVKEVKIISEKGGELRLRNPFNTDDINVNSEFIVEDDIIVITTMKGQLIELKQEN